MEIGSVRDASSAGGGDSPSQPEQARSVERRAQVLAAALRLLLANGSAGVTHRRVAEESGSSPGAVRYYFRSREDLLSACLEQLESARCKEAEEVLERSCGARTTPDRTAWAAIEIYCGAQLDDVTVTGAVWSIVDCARVSPQLGAQLAKHHQSAHQQLRRLLSQSGYSDVAASLVTAVLDGSILASTIEGRSAVAKTAVAELAGMLRQVNQQY